MLEVLLHRLPFAEDTIPSQGVHALFAGINDVDLEVLRPLTGDSPVARFLEKRGEGIHHLAFEVPDIEATYREVQLLGYTPIAPPREGARGKKIFFLHPRDTHGILIEFCQKQPLSLAPTYWTHEGVRLAWYTLGNPHHRPVVLLHGALGSVEMELKALMYALEPFFYVIAPDLPGHGRSGDLTPDLAHPQHMTTLLHSFLKHLAFEKGYLFGFSLGGHLALRLALRAPECFHALALHATHSLHKPVLRQRVLARFNPSFLEKKPEWTQAFDRYHGPDRWKETARLLQEGLASPDGPIDPERIQTLQLPVLLSGGERDELFPPEVVLAFARHFPQARTLILPGIGHSLEMLDPAWLLPFLQDTWN